MKGSEAQFAYWGLILPLNRLLIAAAVIAVIAAAPSTAIASAGGSATSIVVIAATSRFRSGDAVGGPRGRG